MFVQELDIFDEINLTHILEQYYSLETALKSRIDKKLCTGIPEDEEYCIVSVDKLTGEIIGIIKCLGNIFIHIYIGLKMEN
jgi:hypothetical protein